MITLAITSWNRDSMTFDAYRQLINDDRISEIVISDDCSTPEVYSTIIWQAKAFDKVKVYRNEVNQDCYKNKRTAVSLATNDWVIIGDSDNIFTPEYVDRLFSLEWDKNIVIQPSWARPHFDFRKYQGQIVNSSNVASFMEDPTFSTMLNAFNYFVNREQYLKVWDGSLDPVTSDSIFHNYNWLKNGNSIYVCPGLEYEHRVHNQSHYQNNVRRTPHGFHQSIEEKLKQLK